MEANRQGRRDPARGSCGLPRGAQARLAPSPRRKIDIREHYGLFGGGLRPVKLIPGVPGHAQGGAGSTLLPIIVDARTPRGLLRRAGTTRFQPSDASAWTTA
jgi:hypothetical protein